jgi:hypothetical protein
MERLPQIGYQPLNSALPGLGGLARWSGRSLGIAEGSWLGEMSDSVLPEAHPLGLLHEASNSVTSTIGDLSDRVGKYVSDQMQDSLVDQTVHRAGDLSSGVIDSLFQRSTTALQVWSSQHPIAGWFLLHPLVSLVTLVLSISLIWTLMALLGQLLQQTWLTILKAPLVVLLWTGRQMMRWMQDAIARPKSPPVALPEGDRVTDILSRLEHIRQEQDDLMQELKALLEQPHDERAKEPR